MAIETLFRPVGTKDRLVDRVVSEIQTAILTNRLSPGTKLPPEREFAEQMGVSRTVLRESVRILVARGLLETKHGIGTLVREVSNDQVVASLSMLLQTKGISLDDLHRVRSILETEIAGLAALQATPDAVANLSQIVEKMSQNQDDPETVVLLDAEFHRALALTANNPLLVVLLDSFRDLIQEVRLLVHKHPDLLETVMPDHSRILECVVAKDPDGARQVMREHLDNARSIQQQVLARNGRSMM